MSLGARRWLRTLGQDERRRNAHTRRLGDEKVTVLEEILEWSQDRTAWQRDALRRLVLNGELSDDDIHALTEICKSTHGLAEQQDIVPLTEEHVPQNTAGSKPVSLVSIFQRRGEKALSEAKTL